MNNLTDSSSQLPALARRPLIVITEGVFDICCLTRFSQIIHSVHSELPDLHQLAQEGALIFLPAGGGDMSAWITRLAPLQCPEFFLIDREQQPETITRKEIVDQINRRHGCRAALTSKRSLENYLHATAITATFGTTVEITDDSPVSELVARSLPHVDVIWSNLSRRHRHRLIYRAKRRLNTETVQCMTAELLKERDPCGEVMGWFRMIASLLS